MSGTKKVGPAGSFGARYGTVARKRYADIITQLRSHHECPRCRLRTVRRMSVGIWICGRCGLRFAGGAYVPITKLGEVARRAARGGPSMAVQELEKKAAPQLEPEPAEPKRRVGRPARKVKEKTSEAPSD